MINEVGNSLSYALKEYENELLQQSSFIVVF